MGTIRYFGTDLSSAGHYFWQMGTESLYGLNFKDFPFNPERMPTSQRNGDVEFYHIDGWSIMAICGSCKDKRPGSKSVFFIKQEMPDNELLNLIRSIPIANKIINAMPFDINWHTSSTTPK